MCVCAYTLYTYVRYDTQHNKLLEVKIIVFSSTQPENFRKEPFVVKRSRKTTSVNV